MQHSIQPTKRERKQARKARRQAFWGHIWHELVKMEFITNFGDWLEEFSARVVEKLALFSAIYLIVEVGVPAISFQGVHETAMGIILASPELIMVGAFKMATREIKSGNKKAWGLMVCVFLLLILTTITVLELMVWHWSQSDVNKLLAIRFLASIAYTFCHGILKENRYQHEHALPAGNLAQALADLTERLDTELSSLRTQTKQQVDTLSQQLDTLSTGHLSTGRHLSTHLSTVDQSLDTLAADLSRLVQQVSAIDTLNTRLTQVEACQGEHLAHLEQSIRATLREVQKTGRYPVSRQKKDYASLSKQVAGTKHLDTQEQGASLDNQQTEAGLDTLPSKSNTSGKIIHLSRHEKGSAKQPRMTERVLDYIRANHREPSLGEIQSWGCAKQTAVNSREAARAILRWEAQQAEQQTTSDEQVGNDQ